MSNEATPPEAARGVRRARAATIERRPPPTPPVEGSGERESARPHPALRMLNVGYGNLVLASRIVAIVSPQAAPMRRLRAEATSRGKLVDATQGRRTRSILVTDSDHVILSALNPDTLASRLGPGAPVDPGP
jgi:hypothetical protein